MRCCSLHCQDGFVFIRLSSTSFFNDRATTEIYTLSLHDALPISCRASSRWPAPRPAASRSALPPCSWWPRRSPIGTLRSEEHTSELQSRVDLVCRLLLEKKK